MSTSTESLKQLLALAGRATPGPYVHSVQHGVGGVVRGGPLQTFARGQGYSQLFSAHGQEWMRDGEQNANADFIAACSPDVIAELVNELLAAREFIKRNREADEAILKIESDE